MALAVPINAAANPGGVYISPWIDAAQNKDGSWRLPSYPCEIRGLHESDPRSQDWTPGEYVIGVDDQVEEDGVEWLGEKPLQASEADLAKGPESLQAYLRVPHLPGQPVKELFARMKALDPRPFEDRYFEAIHRDMPANWYTLYQQAKYAERFGIHTEQEPAEWGGQEEELLPAAYVTPRENAVTVCVGVADYEEMGVVPSVDMAEAEYDSLVMLYARDQEGKPIQIVRFPNCGITPICFGTFSFVPPLGTSSITPFAYFKVRGVWQGETIDWDPNVGSEDMMWFTEMSPEERKALAEPTKLVGKSKEATELIRFPKKEKRLPVLWPENSWEGNAAKARLWDEQKQ